MSALEHSARMTTTSEQSVPSETRADSVLPAIQIVIATVSIILFRRLRQERSHCSSPSTTFSPAGGVCRQRSKYTSGRA
jgi:hypothetical protein